MEDQLRDIEETALRREKNIFPEDGPDSLYDLIRESFAGWSQLSLAMETLKREEPRLLELSEEELLLLVEPGVKLRQFRLAFWEEYEIAVKDRTKFNFENALGHCFTKKFLFEKILKDLEIVAFLICPPASYVTQLKEAHDLGLKKLREIMASKIVDEDNNLLPRSAEVVVKAFALIDMRLKGAVVQRIDQRTLQVNQNLPPPKSGSQLPTNMADVEKQIEEMRRQLSIPTEKELAIIDVSPEKVNVE